MESFKEAWYVICDYCKTKITDVAYKTWISRIEPVDIDFQKNEAILLVPNDFHRQTLTLCYMPLLNESFEAVFGKTFKIVFHIPEETEDDRDNNKVQDENGVDKDYDYTFDTFIVGSSNKFAHAASIAVASKPAGSYNPLFLYGNSGLGKTHLLYAIGNEIKKAQPHMNICYIKGDDFTNELIDCLGKGEMSEFRNKYRNTDVLLVDDVQFIGGKVSTQEEFFHTFNALYDAHKQIVLTSDRPPKEIKTLEDRLRNRFESGLIADIQPPELETRIAIIKRKAEYMNFMIPTDVCEFIASKLKTNIRQLEGTVKKMKARYLLNNESPSINSVQDIIADVLNNDAPPELTVEKIIEEVARTFGVTAEEIKSQKNRSSKISNARQIAIYIVRSLTPLSMEAIGEAFGNRHYSTIIYTNQKVEKLIKTNSKTKEIVEDIIKNIRDR